MRTLPDGAFHGEQHVSGDQLPDALAALATRLGVPEVPAHGGQLSVYSFDRLLVDQLGLADVAAAVELETRRAGLNPPARFGTEVVARLLGLRFNHPSASDALELYPTAAITRAEAAWSLAQALSFDGSQQDDVRDVLARLRAAALHGRPGGGAADRGFADRHAVCVGRRGRRAAGRPQPARLPGARRLRLLGARMARVQAQRAAGGPRDPRAHGGADGGPGPARGTAPPRPDRARRPAVLRPRPLLAEGDRGPHRPRRHRDEPRLHDQLVGAGGCGGAVVRGLARAGVQLGRGSL